MDVQVGAADGTLPAVLQAAIAQRDSRLTADASYSCHKPNPYSDGYGDSHYGDYDDESSYHDGTND